MIDCMKDNQGERIVEDVEHNFSYVKDELSIYWQYKCLETYIGIAKSKANNAQYEALNSLLVDVFKTPFNDLPIESKKVIANKMISMADELGYTTQVTCLYRKLLG